MAVETDSNLYDVLGLSRKASEVEVRRAYRNLITKAHPDKGGDPEAFKAIQTAYEVLSNAGKREQYDATGKITRTVEEEFMDSFAGGNFRDKAWQAGAARASLSEQITVRQSPKFESHTAGFEAWMRSRGEAGTAVFTAESMAEQFGVVKGSYDATPLPRINAYQVQCARGGPPREVLTVVSEPLPPALEWGEVLVSMRAVPVSPADLYTVTMGGVYGGDKVAPPFTAGHDGVGVVMKVGEGVKALKEGDWVVPGRAGLGTWRTLGVWREPDLLKLPSDLMPLEYAAVVRELALAYRLLEDHASLKPGDCVILNAANSTVGQAVVQLCLLLRLRCVAVIRHHGADDFAKTAQWLTALGAAAVLPDAGSLKAELDKLKFFAKPKLGLDSVGGASALRLSDALAEGGQLVIYGCISGKAPAWPWQSWVFRSQQVCGFNLRNWMAANKKKVPRMLEALGKLIRAEKLRVQYTEYELATELGEALEHAHDAGRNTKVLLRVTDVGTEY